MNFINYATFLEKRWKSALCLETPKNLTIYLLVSARHTRMLMCAPLVLLGSSLKAFKQAKVLKTFILLPHWLHCQNESFIFLLIVKQAGL